MRALAALALALGLLAGAPPVAAEVAIPPLRARVTDLTATLDDAQRQSLEQALAAFEARKGAQIAVLVVPSTQPETIEQYAVRVEESWKLGRKGVDDGVLLVVAKDDRRLRIEVGYGLEGTIPDVVAKRVIEEDIAPRFKQGDFYGGIRAGTERLMRLVDGESLVVEEFQLTSGGYLAVARVAAGGTFQPQLFPGLQINLANLLGEPVGFADAGE